MGNSLFFSFSFLLLLSAKSHLFLKYDSICHNFFHTQIFERKKKRTIFLHCFACEFIIIVIFVYFTSKAWADYTCTSDILIYNLN